MKKVMFVFNRHAYVGRVAFISNGHTCLEKVMFAPNRHNISIRHSGLNGHGQP